MLSSEVICISFLSLTHACKRQMIAGKKGEQALLQSAGKKYARMNK